MDIRVTLSGVLWVTSMMWMKQPLCFEAKADVRLQDLNCCLLPAAVTHEHLKDRGLFSLPPLPPGLNPADYHHLMANNQRRPCGDLLMQNGVAAHLPGYISPMDGKQVNGSNRGGGKKVNLKL